MNHKTLIWLFVLLALVQAACGTRQELPGGPTHPANFPEQFYLSAVNDPEKRVYKIDSDLSLLILNVYRSGVMARLGHDHVIASRNVQGYIALNQNVGWCNADIFVPLSLLNVDDPQLRVVAKLDTTPSEKDIINTKINMLKSINAENFPFVQLTSEDCSAGFSGDDISVRLTLHGMNQQRNLQVNLETIEGEKLVVSGEFSINQTDFGIESFSVMGGLLKVKDRVDITYRLTARRIAH